MKLGISLYLIFFCVVSIFSSALAAPAERTLPLASDAVFLSAKRFVMKEYGVSDQEPVILVEDRNSGYLRFRFYEGDREDKNAVIESISRGDGQTKLRVELSGVFAGREEWLVQKIAEAAKADQDSLQGVEIPNPPAEVYPSIKRFLLRHLVTGEFKKEDVIRIDAEDIGFLKFAYRGANTFERNATVSLLSSGDSTKIRVDLPGHSEAKRLMVEDAIVASVKADLGITKTSPRVTLP